MKYLISYAEVNRIKNAKYKTWQQKFLWFLNFYYTKENKEQLFTEDFYAFNYGPVSRTILDLQYQNNENLFLYESCEKAWEIVSEEKTEDKTPLLRYKDEIEIEEKFIKEFEDRSKWDLFKKIFNECKEKNPNKLVFLSHTQFLWESKIDLSIEERRISQEDIIKEETDPLNLLKVNND
ncbi:Panacea domain-containing protein [Mycoplasma procyoni]|uniref:Panacea domain-containing protein n=1 Tax=Mycoplasma procyoni TaxID=568784 RepID=UPI00197BB737|nr:Panacea domain-containing protein [Mycoplasma procyoni]MBN3534666.1 SocA family protein [Mycoplasma procyoni]